MQITHKSGIHVNSDDPKIFISPIQKYVSHSRPILILLRSQKMRVPILLFDDPAAKKAISKRQFLDLFDCIGRPCPRRVKACLSILFCLAFFIFALYLNIVTVFFWERHSSGQTLPLVQQNVKNLRNESAEMDQRMRKMRAELDASLSELLKGMPAKDEGWCERMANNEMDQMEMNALAQWKFDPKKFQILPNAGMRVDPANMPEFGCLTLSRLFPFKREPLSEEERQFPLAYGLVVHKSAIQVFALLSAIYQPQNAYCLAVDERADEQFRQEMNLLADCFPNIFVMGVGKVEWCQFGVVRGVFNCLRYLSHLNHEWKYFQYLSGVDLPLKTNLEMVRIFKHLNGTVNAELLPFETARVQGAQVLMNSPLTLWKSSLSALLSRQAVDAIVGSETVRQFLRYLQYGYCTDEALWATICGNPKELFIPGGFDATQLYGRLFKETYLSEIRQKRMELEKRQKSKIVSQTTLPPSVNDTSSSNSKESVGNVTEPFQLATYYISRYQVWRSTNLLSGSRETKCNGTFISNSCVFGIADLPNLMKRPEMVVHKMYLEFQPAAYFCLWKRIHERTLDWRNQRKFEGKVYLELPTVKLANGASEDELRFFFD